jgi:hypothetical protein
MLTITKSVDGATDLTLLEVQTTTWILRHAAAMIAVGVVTVTTEAPGASRPSSMKNVNAKPSFTPRLR